MRPRGWFVRAAAAVLPHPVLWPAALAVLVTLAPPGWWRRWPPLPAPDPAYLRFRLQTQYGDPDHLPEANDLVTFLRWRRDYRRAMRR